MSDLHADNERPDQYRAACHECGTKTADRKRMHSHLRDKHLRQSDLDDWDDDETYIQCNVCGTIRTFDS